MKTKYFREIFISLFLMTVIIFVMAVCGCQTAQQQQDQEAYRYYQYLRSYGSTGTGEGQFNKPRGIAMDSYGNTYIADTYNHRIQKFDSSGNYQIKIGTYGCGTGEFQYPKGVAVDSSGNIYVVEAGGARVQKFNSAGSYVTQWDSWFTQGGHLNAPEGIAIDSSGNIYVANTGSNEVVKYNSSGTYEATLPTGTNPLIEPSSLAIDSSGNMYVGAANGLYKLDSSGQVVSTGSWPITTVSSIGGVAIHSNKYIFCTSTSASNICQFTTTGNFISSSESWTGWSGSCTSPEGIAVSSSGYIYVVVTMSPAKRCVAVFCPQ